MKKILKYVINILPFAVWMLWFYLSLNRNALELEAIDLGLVQIGLLLFIPPFFGIFNYAFSENKIAFLVQSIVFAVSQVAGYYICGVLYYNYISSDSMTEYVRNLFSLISVIYIAVITLILYLIKAHADKKRAGNQTEKKE